MDTKTFAAKVKAAAPNDGLEEGQFWAYASTFDVVDSYGDVVRKGAFEDSLNEWRESGNPIPVLYGHDLYDLFNNIGWVIEASEDDHGLLIKGQMDLETDHGRQAYRLIKGGRVTDLSFAYDVLDAEPGMVDGFEVNQLTRLKLYEVSVVPIGANRETEFLAVKRAEQVAQTMLNRAKSEEGQINPKHVKALRTAHEHLSGAAERIKEVLTLCEKGQPDDQTQASSAGDAKREEHEPAADSSQLDAKRDEQSGALSASALVAMVTAMQKE